MKDEVKIPDLDSYVSKMPAYMSYEEGARRYQMPYWPFVVLAKEAGATKRNKKVTMVDIEIMDQYIDEKMKVELEERKRFEMPKRRTNCEDIENAVKEKKKKYVRPDEGAMLYSLGRTTFLDLAKEAGAIRKIKRVILVNTEKVDEFIESFGDGGY